MFRCVTNLKGLVIDVDSFAEIPTSKWINFYDKFNCVFVTSNELNAKELEQIYNKNDVILFKKYEKYFAPNITTHNQAIERLNCDTTEVAYVSKNSKFINNALEFMSGTIWVTDEISYEEASSSADLICKDIDSLWNLLKENIKGFLGEVTLYPSRENKGLLVPVEFDVDGESFLLCMIGRYFGNNHYMYRIHPYSRAILLNKKPGKAYGIYNEVFGKLYGVAFATVSENHTIDAICSVPSRPGKDNRFETIVDSLAKDNNLNNLTKNFVCRRDYPAQKSSSKKEREENVKGVFELTEDLSGKNVVIIDDIITTGSTMRECVRILKRQGAEEVIILALGINQFGGNYWTSDVDEVKCPSCGSEMILFANSKTKEFFFGCENPDCGKTLSFAEGRGILQRLVNIHKGMINDNNNSI